MQALEIIKRLILLPWALLRPSRLPRCPRCKELLDAHNDHIPWLCWKRCETCKFAGRLSMVDTWSPGKVYCYHSSKYGRWRAKTDWCKHWAQREAEPAGYVAPPSVVAALRSAADAFGEDDEVQP